MCVKITWNAIVINISDAAPRLLLLFYSFWREGQGGYRRDRRFGMVDFYSCGPPVSSFLSKVSNSDLKNITRSHEDLVRRKHPVRTSMPNTSRRSARTRSFIQQARDIPLEVPRYPMIVLVLIQTTSISTAPPAMSPGVR